MKQEIGKRIEKVTDELLKMLSSLNQAQLNKIPFEGSWTAAQVGEHLLKSYSVVEALSGSTKPTPRPPDQKNKGINDIFLNFDLKMTSPDFIVPSNSPIDKEALLQALRKKIKQIDEVIQTKDLTEICLGFELPGSGLLTRLEWLNFINVHTQRHNHQLKNIVRRLSTADQPY